MTETVNDWRGLALLAGELTALAAEGAHAMHGALADRAVPAHRRATHDRIAKAGYGALRVGGRATGFALGFVASAAVAGRSAQPLSGRPGGRAVLSSLNGLIGDRLHAAGNDLALPFSLGDPVGDVGSARVAVLVHGLMETDRSWQRGGPPTYADVLAERGFRVHHVHYNTGLGVALNGAHLATALDELVAGEDPASELVLIGHSMGGLVIRAACHRGGAFVERVSTCVYLGTPHQGAPLAAAARTGAHHLKRWPEASVLSGFLGLRSAGIRDLRQGRITEPVVDLAAEEQRVPLLVGPRHIAVAATLGRRPRGFDARVLGDLLVPFHSASRPGHRRPEPGDAEVEVVHVPGTGHLSLLNEPEVRWRLRGWLAEVQTASS